MWIQSIVDGHWFQAEVCPQPSQWGINYGRISISKLCISFWPHWVKLSQLHCLYNYDRGLDFDNCSPDLLAKILAYCEQEANALRSHE